MEYDDGNRTYNHVGTISSLFHIDLFDFMEGFHIKKPEATKTLKLENNVDESGTKLSG